MKHIIAELLKTALQSLSIDVPAPIHVEHTRDKSHGDFASNLALSLAKAIQTKPRELAERLVAQIPASELIQKVSIAGPGFINFSLTPTAWQAVVKNIVALGANYGRSRIGEGQSILIEFVSSNPTGPLHVGHGRGAAYGAAVADLLEAAGFHVHREYYVNDGGRQIDILATSVWLRYLQSCGEQLTFPANAYQGDYVTVIAEGLKAAHDGRFLQAAVDVYQGVPADETEGGDKEAHIDGLIAQAKRLLGAANYRLILSKALTTILADIDEDLAAFGVHYQQWFSERSLLDGNAVEHAIANLTAKGHLYEQDGALWFRSTAFGDDKDRVLRRENGQPTYFAVDIAYHLNKLERGFSQLINVLGSDHHGYVPRLQAAIQALGYDPKKLTVLTVQFAVLYRGAERVQMSTRSGSFVTLRELRAEVGTDAARFFYVLRKCEQHMDFDLDLAKSQSNDNPVYYIQYAHARISSVMRQLAEKNWHWEQGAGLQALHRLNEAHELDLLKALARYPETIETAATQYEPHLLAHYLRELAHAFHTYYNTHQFLVSDDELRQSRLALIAAARQVLANGLELLGVTAPETM